MDGCYNRKPMGLQVVMPNCLIKTRLFVSKLTKDLIAHLNLSRKNIFYLRAISLEKEVFSKDYGGDCKGERNEMIQTNM